MSILFCLLAILRTACCSKIIYFSKDTRRNYSVAENYCKSINGNLTSYGEEVVFTAAKCNHQGLAWLGKPFLYNRGCFNVDIDGSDKHGKVGINAQYNSSTCATYCDGLDYIFIGVTLSECVCFKDFDIHSAISKKDCDSQKCSSNPYEYCGVGGSVVIYEKVNKLDNTQDKRIRPSFQYAKNGVTLYRQLDNKILPFFCTVQKVDEEPTKTESQCNLPERMLKPTRTPPSTVTTTSIAKTVTTSISLTVTKYQSASPNTLPKSSRRTNEPKLSTTSNFMITSSPLFGQDNNIRSTPTDTEKEHTDGIDQYVIVVIAGVFSLGMVIIVIIFCYRKKKKRRSDDELKHETVDQQPSEPRDLPENTNFGEIVSQNNNYDHAYFHSAESQPGDGETDENNTYDHTSFSRLRADNDTNIYDHAITSDGVYNKLTLAKTSKSKTDGLSACSNPKQTGNQNEYDTFFTPQF